MEFTLFILLVIAIVLLVRVTNRFDKVNTKLDQVDEKTTRMFQMLHSLKEDLKTFDSREIDNTAVESSKQEEARVVVPPPIPMHIPPIVKSDLTVEEPIERVENASISPVVKQNQDIPDVPVHSPIAEKVGFNTDTVLSTKAENTHRPTRNTTAVVQEESKFVKGLREVNWLNAVGIITLVLGIGFFVKYAIDQDWINEVGRVALGIAIGGIIVGIAHKLSAKYHVFSSILLGGGFATFYTTITLAFREYEIFNQTTAFVILIVITILAILLSIAYKRQEVAIFAFIGGMLAPLLVSTGAGNHVVLFSYILLLNTGVLIVAVRQQWMLIDKFSFALTFLYLFSWLLAKYKMEYQLDAIVFTTLFFLQFMLLLALRYKPQSKEKSAWGQLLYIALTNFTTLTCFFIIHASSSGVNYFGIIIIGMALINALFLVQMTRKNTITVDKNFTYTLLAITVGLVSLAIPVQLSKVYITVVWAVEMSVLLWIWTRTKANLFRVGAVILGFLTIISYLMDVSNFRPLYEYSEEVAVLIHLQSLIINQYTLTGIVVLLSFFFTYKVLSKNPIKEEDTIGLKEIPQPPSKTIQTIAYWVLIVGTYLVAFLEISYQVACRIEFSASGITSGVYKTFSLVVYTVVFVTVFFGLYKKKITAQSHVVFTVLSGIMLLLFAISAAELREEIFKYEQYGKAYFALHLVALGALLYFYYKLYLTLVVGKGKVFTWIQAILFASLVLLCSVELDHIAIWVSSTPDSYYRILSDIHAYGYPILWGLMAMFLMIIGINKEKAELRKLSLLSFGIIVLKFYLYDVWRMNQGGKIASFVVLGIILLVVSFLLERIKLLLKDKEEMQKDTHVSEHNESE